MTLNDKTAIKIKELREAKNFSQSAFAKMLSMSNSSYSRLENGEIQISLNVVEKISQQLQIPIIEILNLPISQINNFNNNQLCPIHNGVLNISLNSEEIKSILHTLFPSQK